MKNEWFKVCLVHVFKQQFSVFKQYYMYFHILFYSLIFPHMFLDNKFSVFKCMYQTPPYTFIITALWSVKFGLIPHVFYYYIMNMFIIAWYKILNYFFFFFPFFFFFSEKILNYLNVHEKNKMHGKVPWARNGSLWWYNTWAERHSITLG